jgi:hypothetical protein
LEWAQVLAEHEVPVELHLYPEGARGLGLGRPRLRSVHEWTGGFERFWNDRGERGLLVTPMSVRVAVTLGLGDLAGDEGATADQLAAELSPGQKFEITSSSTRSIVPGTRAS